MKSKTLSLIGNHLKFLKEQGDLPEDPAQDVENAPQDATEVVEPEPSQELPFTSQAENEYIMNMLFAAKFVPTEEEQMQLDNLISQMKQKQFTNARGEILPQIISMIDAESESDSFRDQLNEID